MDRVYVANLPPDIRIKDIDDFFRPFGKLVYIDVNNRSNPVYAYVQFDNARNAFNAVKSRHGYDYEGYTLQLRLVGNEVRKRDVTPPPPPPPMYNSYEQQNNGGGFNNPMAGNQSISSFQTNSNAQWSNNNRSGMTQQQNMIQYPTINRNNMQKNMDNRQLNIMQPAGGPSNMTQQYSNTNRSDMVQYPNSNMYNQNSGNSNMYNQNLNYQSRSDMSQRNNYSSNSSSNMQHHYSNNSNRSQQQQMNMMGYSNNMSWNSGSNSSGNNGNNGSWNRENNNSWNRENSSWNRDNNSWNSGNNSSWGNDTNNMNLNSGNRGSNSNNARPTKSYNAATDPYAQVWFEDNYTRGLSGSGRKWFNRFIRKGFSPEMARARALEHRTLPYLRDDPKKKLYVNDPTNAALETIGNTIISLMTTNPPASIGGGNTDMPGPSSQAPRNAVSKRQYLRSLDILKSLRNKRDFNSNDRISKKYHTQIVKDYELFQRSSNNRGGTSTSRDIRNERPSISNVSIEKLEEMLRKKKGELLRAVRSLESEQDGKKRMGSPYKKRLRKLVQVGFNELEAKTLALNHLEKLEPLMALKRQYDKKLKKIDFIPANKNILKEIPKSEVYSNDIKTLNTYKEHGLANLSRRIKAAVSQCIERIHSYEREQNLPLTGGTFVTMIQREKNLYEKKKNDEKKAISTKEAVAQKPTPSAATTNTNIKKEEETNNENAKVVEEELQDEQNRNDKDNENIEEDHQDNENIADQDTENYAEDDQDVEANEQDNEDVAEEDQEEEHDGSEEEYENVEELEDQDQNEDVEDENTEE